MFFGSPTIAVHLLRGIVGIGFAAVALQYSSILGWWTLVPALIAFVCLGGCPMCWTVGLVDTILRRKKVGCPTCGHGSPD